MTVGLVKALDPPYDFPFFKKALALNLNASALTKILAEKSV